MSHNTMKTSDTDSSEESQDELAAGVLCCAKAENKLALVGCIALIALLRLTMFWPLL